jgi:tetratricopeptide (TPR) repeat protein
MAVPGETIDLLTRAVAAQRSGQADEAVRLYELVLTREPGNADALHLLGVVHAERGDTGRAASLMAAAVQANPRHAAIHFNYANLLQSVGALREALAHYDMATNVDPNAAQAWYNRGNCLARMALTEDSLASFEQALAVRPDYPAACLNRGVAQQKLGRFAAAAESYRRALRLLPGYVQAMCNLGNVLRIDGHWDEARQVCEDAVAQHPGHAEAHAHLGNVLQHLGDAAGALRSYDRALILAPELASAQWNRALTLLRAGEYAEGWRAFEWRKRLSTPVAVRSFTQPAWTGEEDLTGKTLFLYWEQGMGDTLQFCRFAWMAQARGAKVILSVPDALVRLARSLHADITVISTHAVPPHFDLHCALMSLPAALRLRLEDLPGAIPYLRADASERAIWRERLGSLRGLKVGLVWSGAPRPDDPEANAIDQRRSMHLGQLATLVSTPGISFVSLQKGPAKANSQPGGMELHDWTANLSDFSDTAALVAELDLVIAVDTSVVHLAGALGAPVWVLNRFDHCWRWLSGTGSSPWYPSARLFRQPRPGDWTAVVAEVAAALAYWASGRTA